MKKVIFFSVLLTIGLIGPSPLRAQSCAVWPADCPDKDYKNLDRADDSTDKMNNPIVSQEVAMEHRLRGLTADLMSRIAAKEIWDVAELTEDGSSGFRTPDGSVLKYELRPPHSFHIRYQVIVNNDSLSAWSAWLKDLSDRRLKNMQDYSSRVTAQPGRAEALEKDAAQKDKSFESEKNTRGLAFRDATVLIVEFDVNARNARVENGRAAGSGGSADGAFGFGLLRWYSIPEPDPLNAVNLYSHSKNVVLALNGAWNPQPNGEGFYTAKFSRDIKCDRVQTIAMTLSGNRAAMRKYLNDLTAGELNKW